MMNSRKKKKVIKQILCYFDRLEDHIRGGLSHYPVVYAFVGGIGIVLFWKGVWESAEYFDILYGPGSILLSLILLLSTGLFVSYFIGDTIIISGLRREKKLIDKEEHEIFNEEREIEKIEEKMEKIDDQLEELVDPSPVVLVPEKKYRRKK